MEEGREGNQKKIKKEGKGGRGRAAGGRGAGAVGGRASGAAGGRGRGGKKKRAEIREGDPLWVVNRDPGEVFVWEVKPPKNDRDGNRLKKAK